MEKWHGHHRKPRRGAHPGTSREAAAPPWTYRCHLPERSVLVDVDAFTLDEAVALAVVHWGVQTSEVEVEGRRRRWMRWIGRSTHDAHDRIGVGRGWRVACEYALGGLICFVVALPIGLVVGEVLAQQYQLSMEVKRAELERLQAESAAPTDRVPAGAEENGR